MIDPELLKSLGCPLHPDRPPLREESGHLVCPEGHRFPVVDGIPHLLPEDAILPENIDER